MAAQPNLQKKSSCLDEIEKIQVNREERRKRMEEAKKKRNQRTADNEAAGIKVDVDFQVMVEQEKENIPFMQPVSLTEIALFSLHHSDFAFRN